MTRKFFLLTILISSLILGQDYVWPTNTGKELTSNFGEFRDKHFHMGLDIRTRSSVGHLLYAVNDGYIQRITTNFNGYGKAIYLKTNEWIPALAPTIIGLALLIFSGEEGKREKRRDKK